LNEAVIVNGNIDTLSASVFGKEQKSVRSCFIHNQVHFEEMLSARANTSLSEIIDFQ